MNRVKILDCTLRDGGYVNNWEFGGENIKKILNKLAESNIDIIESGFLTNKTIYTDGLSKFDTIQKIAEFLPKNKKSLNTVCMINYGEYDINDLPECDNTSIKGIRVAFHKKDLINAIEFCKGILKKGYQLYMQPMVSIAYSDLEFIKLVEIANTIKPYAFYIVDSFGVMKRKDLMRFYYLVDHNLSEEICIGYHSHNNIQLSYSNAQALVDLKTSREIIIDSSVFGMGRGAGNLNTELFIEYLNDANGGNYKSKPLLQIIDEVLNSIYLSNYWGYSLPHYITAKHNCHPNYASYLAEKNTLTIEDISNILGVIDEFNRNNFDKDYIEELYISYQSHKIDDTSNIKELAKIFKDKTVIIIAPGRSINVDTYKIIKEYEKTNTITVSVNFKPDILKIDYIFISNIRRYEELKDKDDTKLIITSNIKVEKQNAYKINYTDLINEIQSVKDNAGLMLIKLMISLGVTTIKLAGYDGYSYDAYTNYAEKEMTLISNNSTVDALNAGIKKMLNEFCKKVKIEFITRSKYSDLEAQ